MKKNVPQNMVIAQSGGPSMVINASLVGAVLAARAATARKRIGKILGARHGIDGIFKRDYVDLRKVSEAKLRKIAETPSSARSVCRRDIGAFTGTYSTSRTVSSCRSTGL